MSVDSVTLRRWTRLLTPGQADMAREILDLRAEVARLQAQVGRLCMPDRSTK